MSNINIAEGFDLRKIITSSKSCFPTKVVKGISIKGNDSFVEINIPQDKMSLQNSKLSISFVNVCGNGEIYIEVDKICSLYVVKNSMDIIIPLVKSFKILKTKKSYGEVSITKISCIVNSTNISYELDNINKKLYTNKLDCSIKSEPKNLTLNLIVEDTQKNLLEDAQKKSIKNIKLFTNKDDIMPKYDDITSKDVVLQNNIASDISCVSNSAKSDAIQKLPVNTKYKYKVSVVMSLKNRIKFLRCTLPFYLKQTMAKDDFEIVCVDDGSTENVKSFLTKYSNVLNIKYIRIDNSKSKIPIWSHTPALSNNVGFKKAEGEVIVICGPEIIHKETNLSECYKYANTGISAFGLVWHSNLNFVNKLFSYSDDSLKKSSFDSLYSINGAKAACITKNTFYWYILSVRKDSVLNINGVDEEFGRGVCGEDDDFANRLNFNGTKNKNIHTIIGIHMEHNSGDDKYDVKRHRNTPAWKSARRTNINRINSWMKKKTAKANINFDWGSDAVITDCIKLGSNNNET